MELSGIGILKDQLDRAVAARAALIDPNHITALRLFNGFYEGCPELVADVYARTLVLYGYASSVERSLSLLASAQAHLLLRLGWLGCVIQKVRTSPDLALRRGRITSGGIPDQQVCENGVWYAIDLLMNQDASLYLDTRNLRLWLQGLRPTGGSVLNTFAYTGALGVAALAGGAGRVVQVDRSRKFMQLALQSCALNHLDAARMELQAVDFFSAVAHFKRTGELFDCVIVDPPYFSTTGKGTVNLLAEAGRVINKLRPLVKDGGYIAAINNALFLKGVDYFASLEQLCQDGYLAIESLIPAPQDQSGYPDTIVSQAPADPAPFNHPTKIVILKVKRKPSSGG